MLLEDFVLKHVTKKEYRLQHHMKRSLPDEQLRAYYAARLQEIVEANLKASAQPEPKNEYFEGVVTGPEKTNGTEIKGIAKLHEKEARSGVGMMWTPVGWHGSRTLAHNEGRCECDEYGQILTTTELEAWRAQDQEGNKYSFVVNGMGFGVGLDANDANKVKEESIKEEEALSSIWDSFPEWRNIELPEATHCEVRDSTVRVACRMQFLPESTQEPGDLQALIKLIAPKHVVLLPSCGDVSKNSLYDSKRTEEGMCPKIHCLNADSPPLRLSLPSLKRKIHLSPQIWQKLSFLKTMDGVRMAKVNAVPIHSTDGQDTRVVELGLCDDSSPPCSEANVNPSERPSDGRVDAAERLPRGGALFMSVGEEPITLSALKDHLGTVGWAGGEVKFHTPRQNSTRPWSARVLTADGKTILGWTKNYKGSSKNGNSALPAPTLRVEGVPGEPFFMARAALYKQCALI